MDCPVCITPMIVVERNQLEVDYCTQCQGIWFDAGELELIPEALGISCEIPDITSFPKATSGEMARKCPRCRQKMEKVTVDEADSSLLDRCVQGHGLWFDRGELEDVIRYFHHADASGERQMVCFLSESFAL